MNFKRFRTPVLGGAVAFAFVIAGMAVMSKPSVAGPPITVYKVPT